MNVPKLRFKEFNDEWNYKTFDELINIKSESYNPSLNKENYKCIELEHINQNTGTINGYCNSQDQKSNKNMFKKNEVLFGKLRPYLKKYWYATFDGVCSSEIWVGKSKNQNIVTNKFIYDLFQSHYFLQLCNLSTGSKMPRADWSFIKEQVIAIPNILEQKKISKTLQLLDKKIELQSKKIEDLKLFKLSKYSSVFSKTNNKIKLSDICIIEKGKQINSDLLIEKGNYYMLNGGILPSGYLNEYNTNENTVTISEGGNSCGYVNFNKTKFWCGGHCYKIISPSVNTSYLYHLLKYNEKIIMDLRVGSGLPNIQKKDLEALKLSIHKNDEQLKIGILFDTFDKKISLETNKLNKSKELKKALMQVMFV